MRAKGHLTIWTRLFLALVTIFWYVRSCLAPFSFCFLNFPKQKGIRGKAFTSGNFCWVDNSSCASSLLLPRPAVNSRNRKNINWILRYRGSNNEFSGTTFSTAPIGLFLPEAASSTSLRKNKEERSLLPEKHSLTGVLLFYPLQISFKFPICISRKLCLAAACVARARAEQRIAICAPTRSELTNPFRKARKRGQFHSAGSGSSLHFSPQMVGWQLCAFLQAF